MKQKKYPTIAAFLLTMLLCFGPATLADTYTELTPGDDDIQQDEVMELAANFFAEKSGLDAQAFYDADWECYFRPVSNWDKTISAEAPTEPFWLITIRNVKGDSGRHMIVYSNQGDLIFWRAHGSHGYSVADPDILDTATTAEPLATDAQEDEVIEATKQALLTQEEYTPAEVNEFTFQASFVYSEQFNTGDSPVWIVYVLLDDTEEWKAAYGYTGFLLSLVPFEQDYTCYDLEDQDFFQETFGDDAFEEKTLLVQMKHGDFSLEERAEIIERWRPYLEEWIETHPYYLNNPGSEYDIVILTPYGVPDENSITQDAAIAIAQEEALRLGASAETMDSRDITVFYYVTDPEHPVWEICFSRAKDLSSAEKESDATYLYNCDVWIDAYSGTIIESVFDDI